MSIDPSQVPKKGCLLAFFTALLNGFPLPDREHDLRDEDFVDADVVERLPYKVRDDFLSPAEKAFFNAVVAALGTRAIVCPKVRLGDILFCAGHQRSWRHINRISQKHMDFVVCSRDRLRPLFAIELDDLSHQRDRAKERDAFKDAAFEAAELPLIRIQNQATWNPAELADKLTSYLEPQKPIVYGTPAESTVPTCPKCGVEMTLRTARRGRQAGDQFYGCVNYPKCREIQRD